MFLFNNPSNPSVESVSPAYLRHNVTHDAMPHDSRSLSVYPPIPAQVAPHPPGSQTASINLE